jgi:mannose-6-phosphate isomerase-like protein (cupin superfamily)
MSEGDAAVGDHTIVHLPDVEDKAPKFGISEFQEARFAHYDLDADTIGLAYIRVKPGSKQAFAHRHENAEEIYVVVSGSGRIKLDDEIKDVRALDAIRIAPRVTRMLEAGDEGLEVLAFGPRHEADGEVIKEGFWDN